MMSSLRRSVFCLAIALAIATPSAAQSVWSERVFVSFNGAYQTSTHDFSDRFEFTRDQETGSTQAEYPVKGGFIFDVGAGYRLWKNLGVGVSVSYLTRDDVAHTDSSFPHPLLFNQPRQVTGDATGINRTETAAHVQIMYLVPAGRLRVVLSGGPSFFNVEQDVVTEVQISQSYPFDTASFSSATTARVKGSKTAFNVGADVMWLFSRYLGAGGVVRFSKATVDLDLPDNRTLSVDAGGPYVGGGVRILF
jgi:opacity protein-like surface antigen